MQGTVCLLIKEVKLRIIKATWCRLLCYAYSNTVHEVLQYEFQPRYQATVGISRVTLSAADKPGYYGKLKHPNVVPLFDKSRETRETCSISNVFCSCSLIQFQSPSCEMSDCATVEPFNWHGVKNNDIA